MQIKQVIKQLKIELKLLKSESKETLQYLKNPEIPYQIEWIQEEIGKAEIEYNKLNDITQDGDKEHLKYEINYAYENLSHAYENMRFRYAVWNFLRDFAPTELINGEPVFVYIDAKKEFFDQKANEFKNIKF